MTGAAWSVDLLDLAGHTIPPQLGAVIFFLLFYGLGVRTPIFPLHGWLPTVAQHGNVAIAPALLLGVKIGIYGMLRFVLPLLPGCGGGSGRHRWWASPPPACSTLRCWPSSKAACAA